jgi:nickel superoxide dismutase
MKCFRLYLLILAAFLFVVLLFSPSVFSHCQVPCGIYDDNLRMEMMAEHIVTIEKSVNEILRLGGEKDKNYNQIVRWVFTKEDHAKEFIRIASEYFLQQRIEPVPEGGANYDRYVEHLKLLHGMMFYSMKCKQGVEVGEVAKLRQYFLRFRKAYSGPLKAEGAGGGLNHEH